MLIKLRKSSSETIPMYIGRAESIKHDLATAGIEISEELLVIQILLGLPEDYDVVVDVLGITATELELETVSSVLNNYTRRGSVSNVARRNT